MSLVSLNGRPPRATAADYARAIRSVGPEHVIMSTDLGQPGNPLHPDGFGAFIAAVRAAGVSRRGLDLRTKENAAKLLGLSIQ